MSVQQGMALPDAILNAPELFLGLQLFFETFLALNEERPMGMGGQGPIAWSAVLRYCQANEIEGEQAEDLFYHIRHMDAEFLRIQNERQVG